MIRFSLTFNADAHFGKMSIFSFGKSGFSPERGHAHWLDLPSPDLPRFQRKEQRRKRKGFLLFLLRFQWLYCTVAVCSVWWKFLTDWDGNIRSYKWPLEDSIIKSNSNYLQVWTMFGLVSFGEIIRVNAERKEAIFWSLSNSALRNLLIIFSLYAVQAYLDISSILLLIIPVSTDVPYPRCTLSSMYPNYGGEIFDKYTGFPIEIRYKNRRENVISY